MRHFTNGQMQYDKDGAWAKLGTVDQAVLERVLEMEYFDRSLPKTTGRELFGDGMAADLIKNMLAEGRSKEDCVATLTAITAESIIRAYREYVPQKTGSDLPDVDEVVSCRSKAQRHC